MDYLLCPKCNGDTFALGVHLLEKDVNELETPYTQPAAWTRVLCLDCKAVSSIERRFEHAPGMHLVLQEG